MGNLDIRRPPEWGVDPTPEKARILRTFDLFVFWTSLAVGLLVFAAGTILVLFFNLTLWEVVGASLIGSVIGAVMLAGAGVFGSKFGVPTMVSLRPILGMKGSWIPSVLNVVQLVGWTSFELYIMGLAAAALTGDFLGPQTILFWIVVFSLVVILLAVGGPLVVIRTWLEKVAIWLVLISTVIIGFQAFQHPVDWNARYTLDAFGAVVPCGSGCSGSMLLAIDLVIAMPISWWPLISDYNRFARSRKDAALGTISGYTFANFTFYFLGAAMVIATLSGNLIAAITALGLGGGVLLLILVDESDNAFADVYSTALSVQNISKKTKQLMVIVVATAVSVGAAFYLSSAKEPIGGGFENFLLLIGAVFVPLLGIVLADFWLVRRGRYDIGEFYGQTSKVKWRAIAAWIPGIALYYWLSPSLVRLILPSYVGPGISLGASMPAFLLSALIYSVLHKLPFPATRPEDPEVDLRKPNDKATIESRLSPP
jgi:putative hydroxymethylpyrimidine transporter CytX